jgi:hypothetical protein
MDVLDTATSAPPEPEDEPEEEPEPKAVWFSRGDAPAYRERVSRYMSDVLAAATYRWSYRPDGKRL